MVTVKQLTDEQVADLADPSLDEIWGCEDVNTLAREVQEYRALRPPCPTCDGKQWWRHVAQSAEGIEGDYVDPCPDCTDGKMPLDQWVALLVETLRSVTTATIGSWDSVRNDIDAVLKMAGVT